MRALQRSGAGTRMKPELSAKSTSRLAAEEEEQLELFQMTSSRLANYLVNEG